MRRTLSSFLLWVLFGMFVIDAASAQEATSSDNEFNRLKKLADSLLGRDAYATKAIPSLERMHELDKDNLYVIENLGVLYTKLTSELPDFTHAFSYLQEAEKKFSRNSDVYYSLACIYSLKNDRAKAVLYLEKAIYYGDIDVDKWIHDAYLENLRQTDWWMRIWLSGKLSELKKTLSLFEETVNNENQLTTDEKIARYESVNRKLKELLPDSSINGHTLFALGYIFEERRDYKKSIEYYNQCITSVVKILGEENPFIASMFAKIGILHSGDSDYEQSLIYLNRALQIRLKVFGEDSVDTASNYSNIGGAYLFKGDYEKASSFLERALAIQLELLGEEDLEIADTYFGLGLLNRDLKQYSKAIRYYEKVLAIRIKTLGQKHPDVAQICSDLAGVYNDKNDYEKALSYFEKALVIWQEAFGTKHPAVALGYSNLGTVYINKEDYDKALSHHEKALAIGLKALGPEHPDVAVSYNNLGIVYLVVPEKIETAGNH